MNIAGGGRTNGNNDNNDGLLEEAIATHPSFVDPCNRLRCDADASRCNGTGVADETCWCRVSTRLVESPENI